MWRNAAHGKDEALRMIHSFTATLPIALPTDAIRAEVEPAVRRLIDLTKTRRQSINEVLNWLRVEFAVEKPGQKLEAFTALDEAAFVDEVKKRRPRSTGRLTPAGLRELGETYWEYAVQVRQSDDEARKLEQRLSDLVNQAYGLTPADIDLMWRTAPPRMPLKGSSATETPSES